MPQKFPRRLSSFFLAGFCFFVTTTLLAECPSFEGLRSQIDENESRAIGGLHCRVRENPQDFDSVKLLSDLYWRRSDTGLASRYSNWLLQSAESDYYRVPAYLRASRFRLYGLGFFVNAKRSNSYEVFSGVSARYYKKNTLRFEYSRDSRKYQGGERQTDHVFTLGHTTTLSRQFYFDLYGSYAKDPNFRQNWSVSAQPHFVSSILGDLSLNTTYKNYDAADVISQRFTVLKRFSSVLSMSFGLDWTLKPEKTASFSQKTQFDWTPRAQTQIRFAGGRTDEGSGLLDDFFSLGGTASYRVILPILLKLSVDYHQGEIREETRFGGGLELAF